MRRQLSEEMHVILQPQFGDPILHPLDKGRRPMQITRHRIVKIRNLLAGHRHRFQRDMLPLPLLDRPRTEHHRLFADPIRHIGLDPLLERFRVNAARQHFGMGQVDQLGHPVAGKETDTQDHVGTLKGRAKDGAGAGLFQRSDRPRPKHGL